MILYHFFRLTDLILQTVPADFVGIQVQIKAFVIGVNRSVLGYIGIVDHAVLATKAWTSTL